MYRLYRLKRNVITLITSTIKLHLKICSSNLCSSNAEVRTHAFVISRHHRCYISSSVESRVVTTYMIYFRSVVLSITSLYIYKVSDSLLTINYKLYPNLLYVWLSKRMDTCLITNINIVSPWLHQSVHTETLV